MLNVTLINDDYAWACMGKQIKVQINGYKMNSRNREVSCSVDIIDVVSKGETVIWSMKNKSGQKGLGNCTDTIFDVIQSPTVQVITLKKDGYCPKSVELAFYDTTKIYDFSIMWRNGNLYFWSNFTTYDFKFHLSKSVTLSLEISSKV